MRDWFYKSAHLICRKAAAKYGIAADTQEESYSSRSDFLCGDMIPVSGEKVPDVRFSGKRITRGLYRSGTGHILNADVNGAANILRKRFPEAFDGTDKNVLLSVERTGLAELYPGVKFRKTEGFHAAKCKGKNMRP